MRKLFLYATLVSVPLSLYTADYSGHLREMTGKRGPVIRLPADPRTRSVTFRFYLDQKGYRTIIAMLETEIGNARRIGNTNLVRQIELTLKGFRKNPLKTIKDISLVGKFNEWMPNRDRMKMTIRNGIAVFSTIKVLRTLHRRTPYRIALFLNPGRGPFSSIYIWIPDPNAPHFETDRFGGKISVLLIPEVEERQE